MKASQWASRWSLVASRWSAAVQGQDALARGFGRRAWASASHGTTPHGTTPRRALGMDMTWVTGRIAVGGGIWTAENMAIVARAGVSHILDMQIEFDDTALAALHNIIVQWTPTDDDFQPKPPELFQRGVNFARQALDQEGTKL